MAALLSSVHRNRNRNLKISKALHLKAKRTRAPAYSRALRRIKEGFPKEGQEKLRFDFQNTRRGQSSACRSDGEGWRWVRVGVFEEMRGPGVTDRGGG